MKFRQVLPGIIHIQFDTSKDAAAAMIRFQEHYESPHPDIRGQIFTLGQIRAKGSRTSGLNTYEGGIGYDPDWAGYNFPDYILDPFKSGLFDPLTEQEQDVVKTLQHTAKPFYIIGTSLDCESAIDHEIAHALYYTNAKYKTAVDNVLAQYNLRGLKKVLAEAGYAKEVLNDECHAYLGPDYHSYLDVFSELCQKYNARVPVEAHDKLMKIFRKYNKFAR